MVWGGCVCGWFWFKVLFGCLDCMFVVLDLGFGFVVACLGGLTLFVVVWVLSWLFGCLLCCLGGRWWFLFVI